MESGDQPGGASRSFRAKLSGGAGGGLPDDLEERLRAMIELGRAAWPALRLDPEVFAGYVGEHIPREPDVDVAGVLREIRAADLYLACACAHCVPGAVRAADEAYLSSLSG